MYRFQFRNIFALRYGSVEIKIMLSDFKRHIHLIILHKLPVSI